MVDMSKSDGSASTWAQRFERVKDATEVIDAISDGQGEDDAKRWVAIGGAGLQLALAATTGNYGELVQTVLAVEEAQTRLLQSIDENVKLLVEGPFKTGRIFLAEAYEVVETPERSAQFVEKAQAKFIEASALATEPMDQAAVEMHIAVTFILLGHSADSRRWLESAYEKTAPKVIELAKQTGNTKVMKGSSTKWTLLITGVYGAAWLAVKKFKGIRRDKRAQDGLRELLPFLNCVAALHTASGGDPVELPAVELIEVKKGQYEMVEVSA